MCSCINCNLGIWGIDLPLQVAVHDREENLKEQVDGIDQYRQQVEPRFARHHGEYIGSRRPMINSLSDIKAFLRRSAAWWEQ